jgi:peptidoglycan/xylan/chitin deacetylase (PgdA/CDA1 family)
MSTINSLGPMQSPPGRASAVCGGDFETQLDLLTSRLEPLDWAGLSDVLRGKGDPPARSFVLTFDDGLREHAETVLPILERRGLKGIFFVPGCVLSKPKMLSAHLVHLLLEALGETKLAEEVKNVLSQTATGAELSEAETAQALKLYHYEPPPLAQLKFLLTMKLPLATRASVVSRLFDKHVGPQQDWTTRWYLNSNHVRELHSLGHTIGGHSFGHEPYGRLDAAALERDIGRSTFALQNLLGASERPFAYPFGSVHPKAARYSMRLVLFGRSEQLTLGWIPNRHP